jgi:ribosomal protein S18 acetylase RimI-like enzyme
VLLNCYGYKEDLYLCYKNNKIIGCFTLRRKSRRMMCLYDFAVLPEYRGLGYSRKILKHIYTLCKADEKKKLCLYLKENNVIARKLYFSEGFQVLK